MSQKRKTQKPRPMGGKNSYARGKVLLDHTVTLFSIFLKKYFAVFHSSCIFYIPTNNTQGFPFIHILPNICYLCSFDDSHSDRCEVIPHCGFDLYFSGN